MRKLRSTTVAALTALILALAACGGSADLTTSTGGVTGAFEAAKAGGLLKQMDFFGCVYSGGKLGGLYSGFLSGLSKETIEATGVDYNEFLGAFKTSFADFKATETSRSGDSAVVHVSVKITLDADMGKLREIVKRYAEKQGIHMDDAAIDAAMSRQLGTLPASDVLEHDVNAVLKDGQWHVCDGTSTAIGTPAVTTASPAATSTATGSTAPTPTASGPVLPSGSGDAIAIVAGSRHNCALLSDGSVRCWGSNSAGELGDGSTTSTEATVAVTGLSGVKAISSWAGSYTCALTNGGGVKCWGTGAVGNGSTAATTTAIDVVGLARGVTSISAGATHACAVLAGGGVQCWGDNSDGQLGDGSRTNSSVPVGVTGMSSGATAVSAGHGYTCALLNSGGVKCWGRNSAGQLGNGSTTASSAPVDVAGLSSGVRAIAAGESYTCALVTTGGVKCWGGKLGIPADVGALPSGAGSISQPLQIACAGMDGGGVKCWTDSDSTAKDLPGVAGTVSAIAFGSQATFCVLMTTGGVNCAKGSTWVEVGGLGIGAGGDPGASPPTGAVGKTTAIAIGFQHTCAITNGGAVTCWGYNSEGALGDGSTTSSDTPVATFGLASGVTAIGASFGYSCAVTGAGGAKCWGRNNYGQLGSGTTANSLIPIDVSGLSSGIRSIALGDSHTCALTTSGAVLCWGQNGARQLGNGTGTDSPLPIAVGSLGSGVQAIDARDTMTCALTGAGGIMCWGTGITGNGLAGNAAIRNETPADVVGLTSGATAIAVGSKHACALMSAGSLRCWGVNSSGQLGNGTNATPASSLPADVPALSGVTAVVAGENHTCVLSSAGGVKCWGRNDAGQLGNGTTASSFAPVDVAGLSSGVTSIRSGDASVCAVLTGGAVKCWGTGFGTAPVAVPGL